MNTPLAPAREPCTCCDKAWCPACTASRATHRQGSTAQQRYYARHREERLAYGKRYGETHRPPRRDTEVSPLPAALVAAALSGMPKLWWHADVFGDGAYLWHCNRWSKIDQLPHVCPTCSARFFEETTP